MGTISKKCFGAALGTVLAFSASLTWAGAEVETNNDFTTDAVSIAANVIGFGFTSGEIGSGDPVSAASTSLNDVDIFKLAASGKYQATITYEAIFNPLDVDPTVTLYFDSNDTAAGTYQAVAIGTNSGLDADGIGTSTFTFTGSPGQDGEYFLAISAAGNEGLHNSTDGFTDFLTTADTSGPEFLAFRNDSFTSFRYSIALTLPAPGIVWLLGGGLLGLIAANKRRKQLA